MSDQYLHPGDRPWTNLLLSVVVTGGTGRQRSVPGYTPEPEGGATVDWDRMLGSWLSSTEKAAVHVARGLAIAEGQGGFPPAVGSAVLAATHRIVEGGPSPTSARMDAYLALRNDERAEARRRMGEAVGE